MDHGRRFVVVGTSGSGKTTVAAAIAEARGLAHIELDALHWSEPGWVEPTDEAFRARVRDALDRAPNGWIVDGNYLHKVEDLIWPTADTIVWLDLPLHVVLRRLTARTARRMRTREELWNGNHEEPRTLVTRDSIILWAIRTHRPNRRRFDARVTDSAYAHLEFVRLRSPAEVERFLATKLR